MKASPRKLRECLKAKGGEVPDGRRQEDSILSSFRRLEAPRFMETDDLLQPKRLATRAISSVLALPSVGGERSRAIQAPDSS